MIYILRMVSVTIVCGAIANGALLKKDGHEET